jgi:hypothetical protein
MQNSHRGHVWTEINDLLSAAVVSITSRIIGDNELAGYRA